MKWETEEKVVAYYLDCGEYHAEVILEEQEAWSSVWSWCVWAKNPSRRMAGGTTNLAEKARRAALDCLKEHLT